MISENLFDQVLLRPARDCPGGHLLIVSGYATAGMADRHMFVLKRERLSVDISLILGMSRACGVVKTQHRAFQRLERETPYGLNFECRYVHQGNPVHAKTYLWLDQNRNCKLAFCGSSNYSLTGFGKGQIESIAPTNPTTIIEFYERIRNNSISCLEDTVDEIIPLVRSTLPRQELESVSLSLLTRNGETGRRSGLNWGHRGNRNRNEAYIPIPKNIRDGDFFPPRREHFTVLTDDGYPLIFVRAQDEGKALETTFDNSEFGRYIRHRIDVPLETFVTRQHLEDYGRTEVCFTKIDSETYLMDFSPNLEPRIE